ncbi:sugar phosphate isomerase/epimerase [Paraburkholderia sp. PGU19]|uniref:sugar phosphate isomerase/epimerase family protein n=1 Tax=Paraburkholderia sp. PGU19 TaxID=2735434 RepID=UPI0015D9A2A0|nr:sugar phosphate isomerase/epimerase [Paraburkholderia sp. PGU19]
MNTWNQDRHGGDTMTYSINGPLLMPFSNVRHLPYAEKLRAAQLAGFGEMSLHPHEVRDVIAGGTSARQMLVMADDHGVRITRLDPLSNWNPHWLPTNMDASYIRDFSIPAVEFFELCEELGCTHASLNATFAAGVVPFDEIVEHYVATCRLAKDHGVICDIENLPMWGVATLKQAWDIVLAADVSNGGLVFDTLHFIRSRSDLGTLESIPGSMIHCVQVNDGPLELTPGRRLEDNCFDRLWPGEGEFPLVEILRTLARTNGLNQVNPEVFSPANFGKPADEIARLSSESIRRVLDQAGIACAS